jgi:RNA polymerase sigma factor (sigma-70 family)
MSSQQNTHPKIYSVLKLARGGNREAEDELFRILRVRFILIAKRRIGEMEAEDIAQDACITVLQKYRGLEDTDRFEPWAYSILRNKIGNILQSRQSQNIVAVDSASLAQRYAGSDTAYPPDLKQRIMSCLMKLIKRYPIYARTLNLAHNGYKTEEICARLKITPNYYYVALNRARKMLKDCIEGGKNE